jgi:hypothetical protein
LTSKSRSVRKYRLISGLAGSWHRNLGFRGFLSGDFVLENCFLWQVLNRRWEFEMFLKFAYMAERSSATDYLTDLTDDIKRTHTLSSLLSSSLFFLRVLGVFAVC